MMEEMSDSLHEEAKVIDEHFSAQRASDGKPSSDDVELELASPGEVARFKESLVRVTPEERTLIGHLFDELKQGVDMEDAPGVLHELLNYMDPIVTVPRIARERHNGVEVVVDQLAEIKERGTYTASTSRYHPKQGALIIGSVAGTHLVGEDRFGLRYIGPRTAIQPRSTGKDNRFHGVVGLGNENTLWREGIDFEIIGNPSVYRDEIIRRVAA